MDGKDVARLVITVLMAALTAWWLWIVAMRLGTPPETTRDGTIILDEFARAKDILILVLPLLTAAVGYWAGSEGRDEARKQARAARVQADEVNHQLLAVLDSSPKGILASAKDHHPGVFPQPEEE